MAEMKTVIDCSLPMDHPDHVKVVPLTKAELKQLERDKKAAAGRTAERDPAEVAAKRVENAETLDEVKAALADFLRGG